MYHNFLFLVPNTYRWLMNMGLLPLCLILLGFGAVAGDLVSFLNEAETQLDMLHDAALAQYKQRCGMDCTQAFDR